MTSFIWKIEWKTFIAILLSHRVNVIIFFSNHIIFDDDKRESKGHTIPNTDKITQTHTHAHRANWITNAFYWMALDGCDQKHIVNSSSNSQCLKIHLCFLSIICNLSTASRSSFHFAYLDGFVFSKIVKYKFYAYHQTENLLNSQSLSVHKMITSHTRPHVCRQSSKS